jgi:hypothetical protein
MTDTSTADSGPLPVFSSSGALQGNLTSAQGQPPSPAGGAPALAPQSPLAALGPPPAPTAGPPPQQSLHVPPMPQQPTQQQLGPAPDAKDYQKGAMEFASAMAVLGAVASKFTRVTGTQALSAFAGALNGWKQGNMQAYEDAAKKWEQDTKATLENNRQIMDKYKLALENRKMNIDEQMSQIQLTAAQYHDKMMYDAAASKNYTLVAQIYEKNAEYTAKATDAAAKLQQKRDEQKQKNEQSAAYWLSPEGQQRFQQLPPAQQAGVKQLIDIYASKNAKPQNAALTKFLEENPNATAQQIQNFQQAAHPPRSASGMSLQQFKQENPNATSADIQEFQAKQAEMNSAARAKGGREANLDIILRVTDSAIPAALAASENVPRGSFVPLNKLIQGGEIATSDVNLGKFAMANLQLAEGWARAMNPTGVMRESDRDKALSFLSTATSKETYKALVEQLRTQIQRERAAIQSGKGLSAPGETPSASESTGAGWTDLGNGVRIREKQ